MANSTDAVASSDWAGEDGFRVLSPSPETDLISFLLLAFLEDDFPRTGEATIVRMNDLIRAVGPEYAAKATLFARQRLNIRSAAFLAAGELSQLINGQPRASNFYRRLPRRPPDVLAVLVYIRERYKIIPSRVKRGLGSYLRSCSEVTLSQYAGEKFLSLKLVDAVNLLHPKHSDPLGKLIRGTLPGFVSATGRNGHGQGSNGQGSNGQDGELWPVDRNPYTIAKAVHSVDLMA